MKIFNLYIETESTRETRDTEMFVDGYTTCASRYSNKIIPELERLKKDHWDKDAFNRLIEKFKNDKLGI